MSTEYIDACIHQWTLDLEELSDLLPDIDQNRSVFKRNVTDLELLTGTLMPTLPWNHAYWNEDKAVYEDTLSSEPPSSSQYRSQDTNYTDSEQYRSPESIDEHLEEQNVEIGLLMGHEIQFLPSLPDPAYQARIASAYNTLLKENCLSEADRLKGCVVVPPSDVDAAVEEIEKYADDPDFASVLIYPDETPLGHSSYDRLYAAAVAADMPVTVHTSGNPVHRQTALGLPEYYVTHDVNLAHGHMSNVISMVVQGVFEKFPDLEVVWAGEGAGWSLQVKWRTSRYYRNYFPLVPRELEEEPQYYIENNCYFTTYPLGDSSDSDMLDLFRVIGTENLLFASGYPRWNSDEHTSVPDLDRESRADIMSNNAQRVYRL